MSGTRGRNDETARARLLVDDVLARSPDDDAAHWLRARICQLNSDYRGVLDAVLPLLVLRPDRPEGWGMVAHALTVLGHQNSAEVARRMHVFSRNLSTDR